MRWSSTRLVALALSHCMVQRMVQLAVGVAVAATLAAAGPVAARPANPRPPSSVEPTTENDKVDAAIRAWSSGDWARVRILLEPLIQGERNLAEPINNEKALRYLADATLNDEATLDAPIREELATAYIQRLLASSDDWRPPEGVHGRQFYALYNKLREQRDTARAQVCVGELFSCKADKAEANARLTRLQSDYAILKKAFDEEEVEIQEKVARNRAVALIPFGVGHFYNGRKGLGAAFLAGELVFGGVGLGLYIARTFNCTREGLSFKRNALTCQGEGAGENVVRQRNAEQAMGLFFLGTVALDIVLAQVTFRPFLTVKKSRMRRQDLDKDSDPDVGKAPRRRPGRRNNAADTTPAATPATTPAAAPGTPPAPTGTMPPPPSSRVRTRDILRISPTPAYVPGGAGFGLAIRF